MDLDTYVGATKFHRYLIDANGVYDFLIKCIVFLSPFSQPADDFEKIIISMRRVNCWPNNYWLSPDNPQTSSLLTRHDFKSQVDITTKNCLLTNNPWVDIYCVAWKYCLKLTTQQLFSPLLPGKFKPRLPTPQPGYRISIILYLTWQFAGCQPGIQPICQPDATKTAIFKLKHLNNVLLNADSFKIFDYLSFYFCYFSIRYYKTIRYSYFTFLLK